MPHINQVISCVKTSNTMIALKSSKKEKSLSFVKVKKNLKKTWFIKITLSM